MSAQDPQQAEQDRVERFKQEIADMGLRDPATSRDRSLLRVGAAGLLLGPIIAIVAYFISHGTRDALLQRDAIIVALIGVSITVAGGALFVRYSMAHFLRFWLARLSFEQQAQTDRVVSALGGPIDAVGTAIPAHAETP